MTDICLLAGVLTLAIYIYIAHSCGTVLDFHQAFPITSSGYSSLKPDGNLIIHMWQFVWRIPFRSTQPIGLERLTGSISGDIIEAHQLKLHV